MQEGRVVPDSVMARLEKRAEEAKKRIAQRKQLEAELVPADSSPANKKTASSKRYAKSGLTSQQVVERASCEVYKNEQLGLFDALPIAQRDAIPTLLTRIPVFMPITKAKQKQLLDEDNALPFETPFGKGKRYGANLSVFDEDVLYALARLSNKKLIGPHESMPIQVSRIYKANEKGSVNVDTVVCTVTDILDCLGLSKGGKMRKDIVDSLERLAATTLVLTLKKEDRYLGKCEIGKPIKLVDIEWQLYSTDGIIYAQFSPIVTYWLESEFTYYDWETRKQLKNRLAKALHRFLSSQPKEFFKLNKLEDIAASVGHHGRKCDLKRTFVRALDELKSVGFLIDYVIEGTGKATPFRLYATRR